MCKRAGRWSQQRARPRGVSLPNPGARLHFLGIILMPASGEKQWQTCCYPTPRGSRETVPELLVLCIPWMSPPHGAVVPVQVTTLDFVRVI